jgi:hypothetical protein
LHNSAEDLIFVRCDVLIVQGSGIGLQSGFVTIPLVVIVVIAVLVVLDITVNLEKYEEKN